MAWTALTYAFESVLTSAKMTQNQDNFTAIAQANSGAPVVRLRGAPWMHDLGLQVSDASTTITSSLTLAGGIHEFADLTISDVTLDTTSAALTFIRCQGTLTFSGTSGISATARGARGGEAGGTPGEAGLDGLWGGAGGNAGGADPGVGGVTRLAASEGASVNSASATLAAILGPGSWGLFESGQGAGLDPQAWGGGGGGATTTGNNGGDGGGVIVIIADVIAFNVGATVSANGQSGSSGSGGGGGGAVIMIANSYSANSGTLTASGGSSAGTPGGAGFTRQFVLGR